MAKGEKMQKILDYVGDRAVDVCDICEIIMTTSYGSSMSKFDYRFDKREELRYEQRRGREERRESQRKIRKYLWKLKKDGLIKNNDGKISLTIQGKSKLKQTRLYSKNYKIKKSKNLIVVSFDIPRLFNKERDWLRGILKIFDFEMIHQSTWVGETKIPEQFIADLETMDILEFIEIFEVKRTGTLRKYKEKGEIEGRK